MSSKDIQAAKERLNNRLTKGARVKNNGNVAFIAKPRKTPEELKAFVDAYKRSAERKKAAQRTNRRIAQEHRCTSPEQLMLEMPRSVEVSHLEPKIIRELVRARSQS